MKYIEIFAARIRSLCRKRNLTINKLATISGLRQSTINNIMRGVAGSPRADTLHKIANALNMTLAEFLDFDELNNYSFDDEEDVTDGMTLE
ncbi:MAG: helix-turn-helix domain-containing protein [Clostridia bacterium]|nr:helix-turn-helix domain-containing protein [Clostridia bacterium]